jgi:putative resolvase
MKIKLSEYAKREGIAYRTAVTHYHQGLITGAYQKTTGAIFVDLGEIKTITESNTMNVALYSRVSTSQNKDNLNAQQSRLEDYAAAKGYTITHNVKEVGSRLNDNRKKLNDLLLKNDWQILIVEDRDRLAPEGGFNFIELFLNKENRYVELLSTVVLN